MSSAWSNSFIGKFLSASKLRMEGRESNYMSFNETSLYSIASFKFMTFSFLFLVAHLILINIVGIFLFGKHHEGYDHLITQQKQLFSCVSTKQEKMSVVSANIKTPTSDVMPRSNSNTNIYCLKRRCLVESRKAQFGNKILQISYFLPYWITYIGCIAYQGYKRIHYKRIIQTCNFDKYVSRNALKDKLQLI